MLKKILLTIIVGYLIINSFSVFAATTYRIDTDEDGVCDDAIIPDIDDLQWEISFSSLGGEQTGSGNPPKLTVTGDATEVIIIPNIEFDGTTPGYHTSWGLINARPIGSFDVAYIFNRFPPDEAQKSSKAPITSGVYNFNLISYGDGFNPSSPEPSVGWEDWEGLPCAVPILCNSPPCPTGWKEYLEDESIGGDCIAEGLPYCPSCNDDPNECNDQNYLCNGVYAEIKFYDGEDDKIIIDSDEWGDTGAGEIPYDKFGFRWWTDSNPGTVDITQTITICGDECSSIGETGCDGDQYWTCTVGADDCYNKDYIGCCQGSNCSAGDYCETDHSCQLLPECKIRNEVGFDYSDAGDGAPCDDGIGCTDDSCSGGSCVGTINDFNCPASTDCIINFCDDLLDCEVNYPLGNSCPLGLGQGHCNGLGECVGCLSDADCGTGISCIGDDCFSYDLICIDGICTDPGSEENCTLFSDINDCNNLSEHVSYLCGWECSAETCPPGSSGTGTCHACENIPDTCSGYNNDVTCEADPCYKKEWDCILLQCDESEAYNCIWDDTDDECKFDGTLDGSSCTYSGEVLQECGEMDIEHMIMKYIGEPKPECEDKTVNYPCKDVVKLGFFSVVNVIVVLVVLILVYCLYVNKKKQEKKKS